MKIINRRIMLFLALSLMLGAFLGGLICKNIVLSISIPIAIFAVGMLLLCKKHPLLFTMCLSLAVGISVFVADYALNSGKTEGNFAVEARIQKEGKGYYYADSITFDGVKYDGKIKIITDKELDIGDEVSFYGEVSKTELSIFDTYSNFLYKDRVFYKVSVSDIKIGENRKTFFEKIIERATLPMYKFMDEREMGIAKSLIFGDKSDLALSDREIIKGTGLSHIFALSGLHVGFLVGIIFFIAKKCKLNKKITFIICLSFIAVYGIITGFPAGLKRAGIMTICALSAPLLRQKNDPLNTLGTAAFLIVLTNPREIFDLSFIMSLSAMLGIIMFFRPISRFLGRKRSLRFITDSIALTTSANIFLLPIFCNVFGKVAVYTIIANLIVMPILTVAFSFLAVAVILTLIFSGFGVLYYLVQFPILAIMLISEFICSLPYAMVSVDSMGINTLFYILSFIVLSRFIKLSKKTKIIIVGGFVLLGCLNVILLWLI